MDESERMKREMGGVSCLNEKERERRQKDSKVKKTSILTHTHWCCGQANGWLVWPSVFVCNQFSASYPSYPSYLLSTSSFPSPLFPQHEHIETRLISQSSLAGLCGKHRSKVGNGRNKKRARPVGELDCGEASILTTSQPRLSQTRFVAMLGEMW